ncbi:UV radiation resistance protein and autophagy-related subunit 14-domain-containing protein [Aspergillus karnatakaensis]|uniref:putative ZIP family zinc transporter n=1 Tax=Aspergillus karnatakaensis TaxID=1810916 RepID=UPI003CCE1271
MSCDICIRAQTPRLRFLCPTCARNQLYQLRVDNATVLLDKEYLAQQVGSAVNPGSTRDKELREHERRDSVTEGSRLWGLQKVRNEQIRSSERIKILANHIENRETGVLNGIRNNIKRTDHLWHSNHIKTAEARIFLCREAASLYGLRQKVRKRDNGLKEYYTIGNNANTWTGAPSDHISTSFSYIAHILVLVSNYLSLRLPAEITLPHKNYPTPTIYTPSASYRPRELYSMSLHDFLPGSPTTSCATDQHTPRPRPLCIDKPLPKLAKEDPATYGLFIEGVTLLAWNVSWLCRSQGLNLASDSWEDVCDIGKNLWQLLVAPPGQSSTLVRALTGRDIQSKMKTPKDSPRTTIQRTKSFPMLGHYSHGTAHSFLGASEGTEFIRSWRLPTPTKVVDRLKSTLLGEMASAEWELVEEKEWDDLPHETSQTNSRGHVSASETGRDLGQKSADPRALIPKTDSSVNPTNSPRSKGTKSRSGASALSGIPDALLREELFRRNVYRDSNDTKPACGSIKQGAYNAPAHVMALFLILVLSTLACSFPIIARRFPRLPIPRRFLFLSRHFGTGVLIATAFVHLLPTAFISLTDPCLPRFWSQSYRAMAGFVAMISVFVVVLVEMFFAMKGAGHVHGSEYNQLIGEDPHSNGTERTDDTRYLHGRSSTDGLHLSPLPETGRTLSTEADDIPLRNSTDDFGPESSALHLMKDDEIIDTAESAEHNITSPNGNHRRSTHTHHRRSQTGVLDAKITLQNPQRQLLQCLLLEAGILFHSVFIGMAVSVATGTSFVVLLVAICFHQTFEGFALGSRIASLIPDLFPPSSIKPWLMSLAYGATTPIGQALGLVLHNFYDPASSTGLLMVGTTNAISSGLLLFAGLVELLAEDFLSEDSYVTLQGQRRVEACIAVAAGALLMAFVGAFA